MLPLTNHSSTQLDPFKYTEQPRLRAIVFLAEAVSLARMGMLPKTWEHPQATACISTDLTPKPSLKVVLPSNRNSFSNRTWALACALAKICLKGKWQVDFQPVCFVACFLTLDTSYAGSLWALVIPLICKSEEPCTCTCLCVSVAGSLNGQRIDNIPCISYFISKHPSWSRQTKQTCQKMPKLAPCTGI